MAYELVYTSAPEGVMRGSYGFCVVACTRGMNPRLIATLEALSAYKPLYPHYAENAWDNPVSRSHYIYDGGGARRHILSRVCFNGVDHTRRSNKLASHLVLDESEAAAAAGGPGSLLLREELFKDASWPIHAEMYESTLTIPATSAREAKCPTWQEVMGDAGWGGFMVQSFLERPERNFYLAYDPAQQGTVIRLFDEAINLLPADKRWLVTFNTYFVTLPAGMSCVWRGVPLGSDALLAARRSPANAVIDLAKPRPCDARGEWIEAARGGVRPTYRAEARQANIAAAPKTPTIDDEEEHSFDIRSGTPTAEEPAPAAAPAANVPMTPVRKPPKTHRRWWIAMAAAVVVAIAVSVTVVIVVGGGSRRVSSGDSSAKDADRKTPTAEETAAGKQPRAEAAKHAEKTPNFAALPKTPAAKPAAAPQAQGPKPAASPEAPAAKPAAAPQAQGPKPAASPEAPAAPVNVMPPADPPELVWTKAGAIYEKGGRLTIRLGKIQKDKVLIYLNGKKWMDKKPFISDNGRFRSTTVEYDEKTGTLTISADKKFPPKDDCSYLMKVKAGDKEYPLFFSPGVSRIVGGKYRLIIDGKDGSISPHIVDVRLPKRICHNGKPTDEFKYRLRCGTHKVALTLSKDGKTLKGTYEDKQLKRLHALKRKMWKYIDKPGKDIPDDRQEKWKEFKGQREAAQKEIKNGVEDLSFELKKMVREGRCIKLDANDVSQIIEKTKKDDSYPRNLSLLLDDKKFAEFLQRYESESLKPLTGKLRKQFVQLEKSEAGMTRIIMECVPLKDAGGAPLDTAIRKRADELEKELGNAQLFIVLGQEEFPQTEMKAQ